MLKDIRVIIICILEDRAKAHGGFLLKAFFYDLLQVREGPSAYKQYIIRVDRCHGGHGILLVGTHRHLHRAPLQKLKKLLLHGLTADIPGIGLLLLGNLINLINEDNTTLRPLHIIVSCRQKLGHHALNIIADVSCLCKRGCVCNGQGHI